MDGCWPSHLESGGDDPPVQLRRRNHPLSPNVSPDGAAQSAVTTGPGGDHLAADTGIQVEVDVITTESHRTQNTVGRHKRPVTPNRPQENGRGGKRANMPAASTWGHAQHQPQPVDIRDSEELSTLDQWWEKLTKKHHISETPEPDPETKYQQLRQQIEKALTQIKTVVKASLAPLPTQTEDGTELPAQKKQSTIDLLADVLRDLSELGPARVGTLIKIAEKAVTDQDINDKKYYMERLIQATALLPADPVQTKLTDSFLTQLWDDLQHPPQILLKPEFQYRMPDGSNNNYLMPNIGKAGMPYARTVAPMTPQSGEMPDPGLLFDTMMARKDDKGTPHPNKISSMLFYLASIIIHDVFKTKRGHFNISDTSSYLDLAPLYGSTWDDQKKMRTMKDGKIKPDCFSEVRLLTFPPGVGALLIMFNRYHNYVVEQLSAIDENGRFTDRGAKEERYGELIDKRDDDLFQTGRLIVCGLYANIILIDYVRTILDLNRTDENWQLNPRDEMEGGPPRGQGNQVSAEFNMVYRWHAAISTRDDAWTQALFRQLLEENHMNMTPAQAAEPQNIYKFMGLLGKVESEYLAQSPEQRQFPVLQEDRKVLTRGANGKYNDDGLAQILTDGINDCANAFGPQQVPPVMKAVEVLGIMQARALRLATLNEFRKHFMLEPHREFSDITKNVEVQNALKQLYDTPDDVELYPGLVIEDAKRPMLPGSGLCPGFTISRAILSDAVALIRGDRFYTTSFTPEALTSWGFEEASSDLSIDNGCVFYKLFLRALPNNYDPMSVYVHYPLTLPNGQGGMKETLTRLGTAHKYNFDDPKPIAQPTIIFSYEAAVKIMENKDDFRVTWGKAIEFLMGPYGADFCLSGDGKKNWESRELMEKALYQGDSARTMPSAGSQEKWLKSVRTFYEVMTTRLLKEKSRELSGKNYVDIVRDVGNMVHVHFGAEMFCLPLKTEAFPRGIITEEQMYMIMAAVFICVFFDVDPPKSFPLRMKAYEATQQLGEFVKFLVQLVKTGGDLAKAGVQSIDPISPELREYGLHMISMLLRAEPDVDKLVWGNIMGTVGGMVANQGQLWAQAMSFFMSPEGLQEHWPQVQALAREDTDEAFDKLMHYFMEASRLNGETGVFRWVAEDQTVPITDKSSFVRDGKTHVYEKSYTFKKNDVIMVDLKAASRDPFAFPNPDSVDLTRPLDKYIHLGHGPHQCLGLPMTMVALTAVLKIVARLDGLQPAIVSVGGFGVPSTVKKVLKEFVPGDLAYIPESWHYHEFLTEDWDSYFPFPTTLQVTFNGPVLDVPTPAEKK